jgi:hypothetical protein
MGAVWTNRDHLAFVDINLDPAEGFAGAYLAGRPVCPHRDSSIVAHGVLTLAVLVSTSVKKIAPLRECDWKAHERWMKVRQRGHCE